VRRIRGTDGVPCECTVSIDPQTAESAITRKAADSIGALGSRMRGRCDDGTEREYEYDSETDERRAVSDSEDQRIEAIGYSLDPDSKREDVRRCRNAPIKKRATEKDKESEAS